jgi:hypothetical protein
MCPRNYSQDPAVALSHGGEIEAHHFLNDDNNAQEKLEVGVLRK